MSIAGTISIPGNAERAAVVDKNVQADMTLIERIVKGDQAALRILMTRHQSRVYRFVLRFVRDRNVAEDVVTDTFVAAWRQAPQFENRSSIATWLLAIARYKALSARERLRAPAERIDDFAATLVDPKHGPDVMVEQKQMAHFLRECMAALPAEQAILLDLVYFREKSVKEAAALTGVSENTVKSRMFLARKKLAAMLSAANIQNAASITVLPEVVSILRAA